MCVPPNKASLSAVITAQSYTFGLWLIRHDSCPLFLYFQYKRINTCKLLLVGLGPINHSLSWTNDRERSVHGIMFAKVWTPEDPRSVPGGPPANPAPTKQGHASHYQEYSMDWDWDVILAAEGIFLVRDIGVPNDLFQFVLVLLLWICVKYL